MRITIRHIEPVPVQRGTIGGYPIRFQSDLTSGMALLRTQTEVSSLVGQDIFTEIDWHTITKVQVLETVEPHTFAMTPLVNASDYEVIGEAAIMDFHGEEGEFLFYEIHVQVEDGWFRGIEFHDADVVVQAGDWIRFTVTDLLFWDTNT